MKLQTLLLFLLSLVAATATPTLEIIGISPGFEIIKSGDQDPSSEKGTAFGIVEIASFRTSEFIFKNSGTTTLLIDELAFAGGPGAFDLKFADGEKSGKIPPGEALTALLTFSPIEESAAAAIATIKSDDPMNPIFTFETSGEGGAAGAVIGVSGAPGDSPNTFEAITRGAFTRTSSDGTLFPVILENTTATSTFRVSNSAESAITIGIASSSIYFLASPPTLTIPPGGSRDYRIDFAPGLITSELSSAITLQTSGIIQDTFTFGVFGDPRANPRLSITARKLGNETGPFSVPQSATPLISSGSALTAQLGETVAQEVTISNRRPDSRLEYTVETSNPAFVLSSNGGALEGREDTTFTVSYTAVTPTASVGRITIRSNDPEDPEFTYTVQGRPPGPALSVGGRTSFVRNIPVPNGTETISPELGNDFGSVIIGSGRKTIAFDLRNPGTEALTISAIRIVTDGEFSLQERSITIDPNRGETLSIGFVPDEAETPVTALVEILTDDPLFPVFSFIVGGEGFVPAEATPAFFQKITADDAFPLATFGDSRRIQLEPVLTGSQTSGELIIRNLGATALTGLAQREIGSGITLGNLPGSIPANGEAIVSVTADPSVGFAGLNFSLARPIAGEEEIYEFTVRAKALSEPIRITGITKNADGTLTIQTYAAPSTAPGELDPSPRLRLSTDLKNWKFPPSSSTRALGQGFYENVIPSIPESQGPIFFRATAY